MTDLSGFLSAEIEAGSFPGASALVGSADAVLAEVFAGHAALEPDRRPVEAGTLFDLASLTKPLCGAALAAVCSDLSLDAPPARFVADWKKTRFDGITVEKLLTHTSGLAAWFPLYVRGEGPAAYHRTLAETEPEAAPGERVIYSDLNFLLLTEILETVCGFSLERAFEEMVSGPCGTQARFRPAPASAFASTEKDDRFERAMVETRGLSYPHFRKGVVCGEVHDGNAYRRGGVSANAGLFGTARDVWALARVWLRPDRRSWARDRTPALSEARSLGWQGRRGAGSAIPEMSPESFGHTGFTGTSLWLDPRRDLIAILLTNRIHPTVRDIPFNEVRQRFHRAVFEAFG